MSVRLTWLQTVPGGRIIARLGEVEVGAVFPDAFLPAARWTFFLARAPFDHRSAPTVERAKAALERDVAAWLRRAGLEQGVAA